MEGVTNFVFSWFPSLCPRARFLSYNHCAPNGNNLLQRLERFFLDAKSGG